MVHNAIAAMHVTSDVLTYLYRYWAKGVTCAGRCTKCCIVAVLLPSAGTDAGMDVNTAAGVPALGEPRATARTCCSSGDGEAVGTGSNCSSSDVLARARRTLLPPLLPLICD